MKKPNLVTLINKYRTLLNAPVGSRIDDNLDLYQQLYDVFTREVNTSINDFHVNLHFVSPFGEVKDIKDSDYLDLTLQTRYIDETDFDDFIFGKKTLDELVRCYCSKMGIKVSTSSDIFDRAYLSWDNYLNHIGYDETNLIVPSEVEVLQNCLNDRGAVWCHNKSCSGKTYTAIKTLKNFTKKAIYNPCYSSSCNYEFVKLVLSAGSNYCLLIDDIQCDIDKAKELMEIVSNSIVELKKRNVKVFFVSWTSLYENVCFKVFEQHIPVHHTLPETFVELLRMRIKNQKLLKICGNNIALLSAAVEIGTMEKNIDAEDALFSSFVHVKNDIEKITQIYKLCVLGTYEYEPSIDFIGMPILTDHDIRIIKSNGSVYNTGHRQICAFIVSYLENKEEFKLPTKDGIIRNFIFAADNKSKWKLLKQLIGDNSENELLAISPIWGALHEFENEIYLQTKKDASWQNTPSSMYFVLSVASLLGVSDEYKSVVSAFCDNFYIRDGHLNLKYDKLKTTNDFILIRENMIREDSTSYNMEFEKGNEFDCNLAHKNWVMGLIVGLKQELARFGYRQIYDAALNDLMAMQQEDGSWYPKRVPWITARILIGLRQAGLTYNDHIVKKGVAYLLTTLNGAQFWDAHTGGWNTVYETSALCLDAIIGSGFAYHNDYRIENVVNYLDCNYKNWMAKDQEIDGSITACVLLKICGIRKYLIDYITNLCERRTVEIIQETEKLDYSIHQSCDTTQIAYFVIELCWFILGQDLPNLLREYISRSQYVKEKVNMKKIFISYCDEGNNFVGRLKKIVDKLSNEGHEVFFYADAPLGTNNIDFMRNIDVCDLVLIMGTPKYKQKATELKSGGVTYEDLIISGAFMNSHREKIIPIAFGSFHDSIPAPLDTNKGLRCQKIDRNFLDNLIQEINKK